MSAIPFIQEVKGEGFVVTDQAKTLLEGNLKKKIIYFFKA